MAWIVIEFERRAVVAAAPAAAVQDNKQQCCLCFGGDYYGNDCDEEERVARLCAHHHHVFSTAELSKHTKHTFTKSQQNILQQHNKHPVKSATLSGTGLLTYYSIFTLWLIVLLLILSELSVVSCAEIQTANSNQDSHGKKDSLSKVAKSQTIQESQQSIDIVSSTSEHVLQHDSIVSNDLKLDEKLVHPASSQSTQQFLESSNEKETSAQSNGQDEKKDVPILNKVSEQEMVVGDSEVHVKVDIDKTGNDNEVKEKREKSARLSDILSEEHVVLSEDPDKSTRKDVTETTTATSSHDKGVASTISTGKEPEKVDDPSLTSGSPTSTPLPTESVSAESTTESVTESTRESVPAESVTESTTEAVSAEAEHSSTTHSPIEIPPSTIPPPAGIDLSQHEMPEFGEWKKEFLQKDEKTNGGLKAVYEPHTSEKASSPDKEMKLRNYASHECGAKVQAANSEAEHVQFSLNENRDEYMRQPCSARKWFVIELCEPIMIRKFDIANMELFSSTFRNFTVSISNSGIPKERPGKAKDWLVIGTFIAKDVRAVQTFTVEQHLYTSFVKFEVIDHYGSEHFCPITLVHVFGTTMDDDDDDDDDENNSVIYTEAVQSSTAAPPGEQAEVNSDTSESGPCFPVEPIVDISVFPPTPGECMMCYQNLSDVPEACTSFYDFFPLPEPAHQRTRFTMTSTPRETMTSDLSDKKSDANDSLKLTKLSEEHVVTVSDDSAEMDLQDNVGSQHESDTETLAASEEQQANHSSNPKHDNVTEDYIPPLPTPPTLAEPPTVAPPTSPEEKSHDNDQVEITKENNQLDGMPAAPVRMKSSKYAIMKLSNSVKTLQLNMTVTNSYLEEMSRKYKNQKDELHKALNTTMRALQNATRKLEHLEKKYQNLEDVTTSLLGEVAYLKQQAEESNSMGYSTPIMSLVIAISFLISCCRRNQTIEQQDIERILERMPDKPRVHFERRGSEGSLVMEKTESTPTTVLKKCQSHAVLTPRPHSAEVKVNSVNGHAVATRLFNDEVDSSVQEPAKLLNGHREEEEEDGCIEIVYPATWRTYDTPNDKQTYRKKKKKSKALGRLSLFSKNEDNSSTDGDTNTKKRNHKDVPR